MVIFHGYVSLPEGNLRLPLIHLSSIKFCCCSLPQSVIKDHVSPMEDPRLLVRVGHHETNHGNRCKITPRYSKCEKHGDWPLAIIIIHIPLRYPLSIKIHWVLHEELHWVIMVVSHRIGITLTDILKGWLETTDLKNPVCYLPESFLWFIPSLLMSFNDYNNCPDISIIFPHPFHENHLKMTCMRRSFSHFMSVSFSHDWSWDMKVSKNGCTPQIIPF